MLEKTQIMFLNDGYKPYEQDDKYFMQKCIRNDAGRKRYFINVYMYDMRPFKRNRQIKDLSDFTYDAEVQFDMRLKETFNVRLLEAINPKQVENFFEKVFKNMNCVCYE